jgi:hypothetical protein
MEYLRQGELTGSFFRDMSMAFIVVTLLFSDQGCESDERRRAEVVVTHLEGFKSFLKQTIRPRLKDDKGRRST